MSGTMGKLTAELTADNAKFDAAMKQSGENATASARMREKAAKLAADAEAFAAKFAGDTVQAHSQRIIYARKLEGAASADMRKAQQLNKAGYLGEEGGANLAAAALQRLTAAKLRTAEASRVQAETSKKGSLSFSEHIEGLRVGGGVGESVVAIGAALGVAEAASKMKEAIAASLEFGEAMQRAHEKTGLEVETLSLLHYASATTGGDFDKMTAAVAKMDKTIGAATQGNKTAQAFMKSLGLDATELAGRSDGAEIAFKKFAQVLSTTENPIRRVELATGLLGKAGAEQIPTLIQLGENWDAFRDKASAAGVLLDSKTAAQLEATQQRLKDMQQHILGAGLAFTEGFIPSLNQMIGVITGGKSQMDAMKNWGDDMGKTFAFVAEVIYSAASAAEFLFSASEGGSLTEGGRKDMAAAKELQKQAEEFHGIAFAKPAPAPTPGLGDEDADFLDRNHLGGRGKKTKVGGEGFEGIGDINAESKAEAAARKAAAAQKKADDEAIKLMQADHLAWQAVADRGKLDEQAYWADRISKMVDGAGSYTAAMKRTNALMLEAKKEFNKATVAVNREQSEAIETFRKEYFADFNKTGGSLTPEADKSNEKAQGEFARDYIQSLRAQVDGQTANADAIARASIEMQVATGNMTRLGAAQAMAALHAQEYNEALDKLKDREDYIRSSIPAGAEPTLEQKAQLNTIQTQRANLDTTHTIQVQQDQVATGGRDSSALVGAKDALEEFIAATRDTASELRNLTTGALSGFNAEVVKGVSGQRTSFGDFGAGLGRDVAGAALKKGEGSILSMFGLGDKSKKPSGTAGDPLYVAMVNSQKLPSFLGGNKSSGGGGPDLLSSLFSSGGDSSGDSGGDSGGGLGGMFSSIVPFISNFAGGFASGGAIDPDQWAIVGEEGPEPIFSGSRGLSVLPNSSLNGGGGDTHQHTWNIDARGATDPAQIHEQIMAAAPHIAAAAVKAVSEGRMRSPSTRRG